MDDELKKFIESTAADTRRHFDTVVERLESKIGLVAEGVSTNTRQIQNLTEKVDVIDERLATVETKAASIDTRLDRVEMRLDRVEIRLDGIDTRLDGISRDMKAEFSDVRSMIKFSHAELDRRIRSLEEGFADLQARVERLETSTH